MIDPHQIRQAVAALEAQRAALGEEVVQTGLAALQEQLARLNQAELTASALRGERKQVTVMFADISGFTAMSEKLDPEEVRRIINACFERLGAVIARYEGHIDKFIGDEIMALFGAPVAHENDPERALRAALDMVTALDRFNEEYAAHISQPLSLHFGINTGLVIAGGIGTGQRQDYSVMGDPVNLAARLEGLSESGQILVGEGTYRAAAAWFEFERLKPVTVKGKEKPVQIYRLLKARAVPGRARGLEGLTSPVVGRQPEIDLLQEKLVDLQQGRGGVVSVVGEAGLGKSRLVAELKLICDRQFKEAQIDWAAGQALSHSESASYLIVRHLLCDLLGVGPESSVSEVSQALQAEMARFFPDQAAGMIPYLAYLLELPLDEAAAQRLRYLEGEALYRQILETVQRYLAARAGLAPLVLVWEDLHWIDPSSLALLEGLLPLIRNHPILVLMLYRPRPDSRIWAFQSKVTSLMGQACGYIELAPLTLAESKLLLANLLGACDLPESQRELIVGKAEGNPFYLEEVIRSLIEQGGLIWTEESQSWVVTPGLQDIPLPDSLQGIIMARIDRLDPALKRTLQAASVIGRTFSYPVLAQLLDR